MPRTPSDYSKTILYKFVCNDLSIVDEYIGHTTHFIKRKNHHKASCMGNTGNSVCKLYTMINNNGGWDNWTMIEIEKYPCRDGNEARARERYHYELSNANMNDRSPFGRLLNNSDRAKEWRENKGKKICLCGKSISACNFKRHLLICQSSSSSSSPDV